MVSSIKCHWCKNYASYVQRADNRANTNNFYYCRTCIILIRGNTHRQRFLNTLIGMVT